MEFDNTQEGRDQLWEMFTNPRVESFWSPLFSNPNFEIYSNYPYPIRNRHTLRECSEWISHGYLMVRLGRKLAYKHRLIADQFVPNYKGWNCVDHQNHDKLDNHSYNLRWCSTRHNLNNRKDQTRVCDLPFWDKIRVTHYGDHEFSELFFYNNYFYRFNGIDYTKLPRYQTVSGSYKTNTTDDDGQLVTLHFGKFKREYGLM